jgi:hypothetical protein
MTIWILVVVLLLSLAGLGYRQGAIRVAFSLLGIIVAALLALPLAPLVKPLLPIFGVKNLLLLWLLPPFIAFVIINSLFKAGALPVHKKVDVYFKYKAGDLRLALFERLNARLGFCLGLVNGTIYLVLILLPVYMLGYWTVQMATSEDDPWTVRLFNRVARDMQDTGLARVAKAIDPLPTWYYDTADLVGLLYHNPLADARLVRYPTLFALGARPEFQELAKDNNFTKLRMNKATPFRELINYPQVDGILKNTELLGIVWAKIQPDLADLKTYLTTGKSPKYGKEPFLGTWSFDFSAAFAEYRKANPKLTALQLRETRKFLSGLFLNITVTVGTEGFIVIHGLPRVKPPKAGEPPQAPEARTLAGKWKGSSGSYDLQFDDGGTKLDFEAKVDGDRLMITGETLPLVLERDL